jgi:hypothetical protein
MDWDAFERLVLAMARRLDGAYDVRRYGLPGQAQHGLDLIGFFSEKAPSVYQAKKWQAFDAADLKKAVDLYAKGQQPFAADRIVVAVASEVPDTASVEMLAALRAQYPRLRIELWDRKEISDRLRTRVDVVSTFFGAATAAAFCVSPQPSGDAQPPPPSAIAADAVLRGPVAHLGLSDDLQRGEEIVEEKPGDGAQLLERVADRLESAGFAPHARSVRELQAKALRAADMRDREALIRLALGWSELNSGDSFTASVQAREVVQWQAAPPDIGRAAKALSLAVGLRREYHATLDHLSEAVDALADGDPHRVDAYLILAEEAVADRRPDIVDARATVLEEVARQCHQGGGGPLIAARLRMCVADCVGGWDELAQAARNTYPPGVTALIHARHARHLALAPHPAAAMARWRDAIERACMNGLNDDAADWLYALRTTKVLAGLFGDDINDSHRHAQALKSAGSGTLLPEPFSAGERAQGALHSEKWPEAFEALRRYLWRSVVGADLTSELQAHELLGDLMVKTGRGLPAIAHFVAAGAWKKLLTLASALPDQPVPFTVNLVTPRPWERAAAFTFVAAAADLIEDDEARRWCQTAWEEIASGQPAAGPFAPNPWLAALKAFGQLAMVSTADQAKRFLEMSAKLIPREPHSYRFSDEDQVYALVGIGQAHPKLRSTAVDQLLEALLVDPRMANLVLQHGGELLRGDPNRVAAGTSSAAAAGNFYAAMALILADADLTAVAELAKERLEAAVAPRVHEAGVRTFGTGLAQTALLITALSEDERVRFAEGMLDFAKDADETAPNRIEALSALQGIARSLPDAVCAELF